MGKKTFEIDDSFSNLIQSQNSNVLFEVRSVFNALSQRGEEARAQNDVREAKICDRAANKINQLKKSLGMQNVYLDPRKDMARQILKAYYK